MYVCREDGEPGARWPRLIGWATLRPERDRPRVVLPEPMAIPRGISVSPAATSRLVEFALRTVYDDCVPREGRVVLMVEDQDPTILPGWEPRQERPRRVFARSGTTDFPLRELTRDEFARFPSPHRRGLPLVYCLTREGIPRIAPAPTPEYEIIVERMRMFSFDPPQREPAYMPVLQGLRGEWSVYDDPQVNRYVNDRADAMRYALGAMNDRMARHSLLGPGTYSNRASDAVGLTPETVADSVRQIRAEENAYADRAQRAREERAQALINLTMMPWISPYLNVEAMLGEYLRHLDPSAGMREAFRQTEEIVVANVLRGDRFNWRVPSIDPETAAASKARARGLLRSLLRPEQWAEFERAGQFSERIGEDEFTITPGGMITRRRGALAEKWCVNPDPHADGNDYMPVEDMAIGQLLHLRADPDKVRAAANIFPVGTPLPRDMERFARLS